MYYAVKVESKSSLDSIAIIVYLGNTWHCSLKGKEIDSNMRRISERIPPKSATAPQ